jgi:protein-disulfide isomerase
MPSRFWLLGAQLCTCLALLASAALYVHYLDPADSDYCGLRSGCEAARRSAFSYFGSPYLSLPLFSMLAQVALLSLSLRRGKARPQALARGGAAALWALPELTLFAAAGLGGVLAVALLAYQAFVIGAFCWLCVIADASVIGAALCALGWAGAVRGQEQLPPSPLRPAAWLAIAAVLVAAPLLWNGVRPETPVPPSIRALYVPGKINVIEFADFECPYCRRLHALLKPVLAQYGERVAFQRYLIPLPIHPHAELAARAGLCAAAQGKGEAMADQLFSIELSEDSIARAAEALRLDPARYDACMGSAQTAAELERQAALLPEDQFKGLPTMFIGGAMIVGLPSELTLRDALDRALRPPRASLSGPVYVTLTILALAVIAWLGRRRPA